MIQKVLQKGTCAAIVASTALTAGCLDAVDPGSPAIDPDEAKVAGTPTLAHPSIGVLWWEDETDNETCTGVMITPSHVLTAAHCRKQDWFGVSQPNGQMTWRRITGWYVHPNHRVQAPGSATWDNLQWDVAVARLSAPILEVNMLPRAWSTPQLSVPVEIIGYGTTSPANPDENLKRSLTGIELAKVKAMVIETKTYASPLACYGDSGGAVIQVDSSHSRWENGGWSPGLPVLVGIINGGDWQCRSVHATRVDKLESFILDALHMLPSAAT